MDGRRAHEGPAPSPQVLAHRDRLVGHAELYQGGVGDQGLARFWFVAPNVRGETAELLDQLSVAAGVVDRRFDLRAVAHDTGLGHQSSEVPAPKSRPGRRGQTADSAREVSEFAHKRLE